MNGIDLINNLIDELARAKSILFDIVNGMDIPYEDIYELADDISNDLDRYYDVADSINAVNQLILK